MAKPISLTEGEEQLLRNAIAEYKRQIDPPDSDKFNPEGQWETATRILRKLDRRHG